MFRSLCLTILLAGAVFAQTAQMEMPINRNFEETVRNIAPGLMHRHIRSDSTQSEAPISVHILQADMDSIRMRPVLALDQIIGQETTSSMVKRHDALAGVNSGFSYSNNPWSRFHGDPRGFLVLDGEILSEPNDSAWAVGIHTPEGNRQHFTLVRPDVRITFRVGKEMVIRCTGLNRERKDEDRILYTPIWNRTTLVNPDGIEVVVRSGRIVEIRENQPNAVIPPDGFVISTRGGPADQLKQIPIGSPASIALELRDLATGDLLPLANRDYISAGPVLVRNGRPVPEYKGRHWFHEPPFTHRRHPRTAIGWNRSGRVLFLITVDGRQPGHSAGFTLPELAAFLAERDIHTAYNMDGGGSTTMAIQNEVVNRFSDVWGGALGSKPIERRRCDALLLFPR